MSEAGMMGLILHWCYQEMIEHTSLGMEMKS